MSWQPTQQQRVMALKSPLPDDALLLRAFEGRDALSAPFEYVLDVLASRRDIAVGQLLGHNLSVRLERADGSQRWFNGFVAELVQTAWDSGMPGYRIVLRPWLWFLTRSADCRIFQQRSVPEIVRTVLDDHGFSDLELHLSADYAPREYCVQYRESDFAFICRLLEAEGIYYFFRHENGRHVLLLADAYAAHHTVAGYAQLPYYPPGNEQRRAQEHFSDWSASHRVATGCVSLDAFDYLKPRATLLARSRAPDAHDLSALGLYDYPSPHRDGASGERAARLQLEALQSGRHGWRFSGNVRGLGSGDLFSLSNCPEATANAEYLVAAAQYAFSSGAYRSGAGEAPEFRVTLEALPAHEPFRPPRLTPVPRIAGPQTAIVVGPPGEEIWTDQHARIKVRFHWDREGEADENSSCWLRVAQSWAGRQWGATFIPRIGHEVIVDFLEGDPDQPLVTGSVYNADLRPPWSLPEHATQSGLRTASTPGAAGANELRFEDRTGAEEIWLHAQKDLRLRIENDRIERILRDQHVLIERDRYQRVARDLHQQVGGDRMTRIDGGESLDVRQDIHVKAGTDQAYEAGQILQLQAGTHVVIEAGASITLKAGGASIVVGPSGVFINGAPIALNSGGSTGSGPGCSPQPAQPPLEAAPAAHGGLSPAAAERQRQQARVLLDAARFGIPFCERCGQ
ncbi:type VI secretion system Vgr family protein [Plasticicumulans acidivorans]|uniref:Type VI secretion system secreted protein VgrG n=1 Tax=Plasticicumulans acidivorans TaxID=886464 RepID=A0A317MZF0_9GAMM|nr:type VI secretion system tip protein VgrG [Plasticicumulans acidivorans]PWV64758.1 type VI secretion system secreted protein VgrG [Plasticicumulans acidivorans]